MKEGIIRVVFFYGILLGLTGLIYLIFGPGYNHGAGPFIIMPFLTLLLGLFWTTSTLYNYYFKDKTPMRKGILYANTVVIGLFIAAIFILRSQSQYPETSAIDQDELNGSQNGDTTSIEYNGRIISLKVKDSVHFDKRDSLIKAW